MTQSNTSSSRYRSAGLAAALLFIAAADIARAQNNAPPAAGLAPSGNAGPTQQAAPPAAASPQVPSQASGQAPNQAPNQAANQPLPTAPEEKRGFLNGLGDWWNDSVASFSAKMKEQQAKLDEFNKQQSDAAKDAQEAMKKAAGAMFSTSKVIEIQQLCPTAGNGAPDCATAATNVCKAKGFSAGQPIDIRTAERCKASLWVSGQNPTIDSCPVETVLLRVACQQ